MNKMQSLSADETQARPERRIRKPKRWGLMLSLPLLLLAFGIYWWMTSGTTVSTDNAAVKQDIVAVSAQVNGPVSAVEVKNGDQVKAGQVLYRIDPAPFQVALEEAEARLAAARLQTNQLRTQAAGTTSDIVGADADLPPIGEAEAQDWVRAPVETGALEEAQPAAGEMAPPEEPKPQIRLEPAAEKPEFVAEEPRTQEPEPQPAAAAVPAGAPAGTAKPDTEIDIERF